MTHVTNMSLHKSGALNSSEASQSSVEYRVATIELCRKLTVRSNSSAGALREILITVGLYQISNKQSQLAQINLFRCSSQLFCLHLVALSLQSDS